MSTKQRKTARTGRREFLRTALVTTTAGVAAIATAGRATAAPKIAPVAPVAEPAQGYHVTDHIREYYRLASL